MRSALLPVARAGRDQTGADLLGRTRRSCHHRMRRQGFPGSGPGEPFDAVAILPENAAYAIVHNPGEPCEQILLNGGTHRFGQKGVGCLFHRINKHGF